jgi:hypothetical protein
MGRYVIVSITALKRTGPPHLGTQFLVLLRITSQQAEQ